MMLFCNVILRFLAEYKEYDVISNFIPKYAL